MKHTGKRFLSMVLVLILVLAMFPAAVFAEETAQPAATAAETTVEGMTFAVNFTADNLTDAHKETYGSWNIDVVLTANKDITLDGTNTYVAAIYNGFDITDWTAVPPVALGFSAVNIPANTSWGILEYIWIELVDAEYYDHRLNDFLNSEGGISYAVKFTDEFLAANPDLKATVELKLYDPTNEENTIVLASYSYPGDSPELPTATVSQLESSDLTFAMNFLVNEVTAEQLAYYGDWYADFELTVNKDVTFNANGGADGYLSGRYDAWNNGSWVNVPLADVTLAANQPLKVMETAAALLGQKGLQVTFNDVYTSVKDFDCGVYFTPEFLAANPDLEVKLELKMYNPADPSEGYAVGNAYTFRTAPLPTATVTTVANKDLTFAMNFKVDDVTDEQLAYYGDWYADFELTVNKDVTFNANGGADGWLSGQYDAWSENWVNVPFENVTLAANTPLKIMAYAAELMGEPGLQVTFNDVYTSVKDFDCGVYFTPDFLEANPDLDVTLELKMYNPADESESYAIGDTYVFTLATKLPTATVSQIENSDLTFAMNFLLDPITTAQKNYYKDWYADFELTVNKNVTFNANSTTSDGYLSGQYDAWSENWVNVPFEDVTLAPGDPLKIMETAAELMGQPGLQVTFKDIYDSVKDFDCGVYFTPDFLAENPDLEVKLELKMYNPDDLSENYVIGEAYIFTVPALPTATVTEIENADLTFALNFLADQVTSEQLAYYGDWYADFELTVNKDVTFNANSGADGYLSGQYDAYSSNWVNVPFENVTLAANTPLKIMAYAAELMGQSGLKYTYKEVYQFVKDFDCGVYFTPEFLAANPDLEVTLELKMYYPGNENVSHVIGDTYVFTIPDLPTATVTEIENADLTFALNFLVDDVTDEQLAYYGDWYADFELTVNKDVTFNASGGADGWLSGQYDAWSENWVSVPFKDVTLTADTPLKIMEYAAELMGEPGLKYTYKEVYQFVKDFDCGVYFTPEFLAANPDLVVTLELKMYYPGNEKVSHVIGKTYVFTVSDYYVAYNVDTKTPYTKVSDGLQKAAANETVILLCDAKEVTDNNRGIVYVLDRTTFDLNGYTLTADYFTSFGDVIDSSANNGGLLIVPKNCIMLQKQNSQLPVYDTENTGYRFVEILKYNQAYLSAQDKFAFQPLFEEQAHDLLKQGAASTGVTVQVRVTWTQPNGERTQFFKYSDEKVTGFLNSYKSATGKYSLMFTLTVANAQYYEDLAFTAVVVSETGVELCSLTLP